MLRRHWWNPVWNEQLFVVRCAERLMEGERGDLEAEICRRILRYLSNTDPSIAAPSALIFRVLAVSRVEKEFVTQLVFESATHHLH